MKPRNLFFEVMGVFLFETFTILVAMAISISTMLVLSSVTTFPQETVSVGSAMTISSTTLFRISFTALSIIGSLLGWGVARYIKELNLVMEHRASLKGWLNVAVLITALTGAICWVSPGYTLLWVLGGGITLLAFSISFWLDRVLDL